MRLSVCTFAGERPDALHGLVMGLRRSVRPPGELVITVEREPLRDLPAASFPIRQVVLPEGPRSYAAARNAAAARTSGELLVFLDPGCIAHPHLLDDYAAAGRRGGLLMGEVGFLPPGAASPGVDAGPLEPLAVASPDDPAPPAEPVEPCRDYRCFRALNFAVPAHDFAKTGGFDERYLGHGGEDIDFSRTAMASGLPFARLRGAKAYHQHHVQLAPPVDELDTILANAALFRAKWNQPVMEGWLRGFELMGLVERAGEGWRKRREPTEEDRRLAGALAQQPVVGIAAMLEALGAPEAAGQRKRTGPLRPAA